MKKLLSMTLILILAAGLSTRCKKDKGAPPVLPPAESMTIDFSNFTSGVKSADFLLIPKGTEDSNFQFAAVVAGIWKLIINTTLIVPVTSFKLAVGQTPTYLDTKTWQWSYNVTVASVNYKAKLTGVIRSTDVQWKMLITKDGAGAFTDFLWFEGTSKLDGTGGQWILYQSPQVPGAIVKIDWTKSGTTMGYVRYTYTKTADSFKDSYIEYGLTSSTLAYYTVHYYNSTLLKFSDVNVEWNPAAHNGKVKCPDYLGDTKWYCWDTNKINVTCP